MRRAMWKPSWKITGPFPCIGPGPSHPPGWTMADGLAELACPHWSHDTGRLLWQVAEAWGEPCPAHSQHS